MQSPRTNAAPPRLRVRLRRNDSGRRLKIRSVMEIAVPATLIRYRENTRGSHRVGPVWNRAKTPHHRPPCLTTAQLPGIVDLVSHDLLAVGRNLDVEVDGLGIVLLEGVGMGDDVPVRPAKEMFDDSNLCSCGLAVADLDLEGFVHRAT